MTTGIVKPIASSSDGGKAPSTASTDHVSRTSSASESYTCTVATSSPTGSIQRKDGLSATATLINFLKGMIGASSLSLPLAFRQAGLWTAFVLVFVMGFLNNHCMLQLVHCSQHLARRSGRTHMDYGNLAYAAFGSTFYSLRRYKMAAKIVVNTTIIALQFGISSVIYVFITSHLKEVFDELTGFHVSIAVWMLLMLGPLVFINLFRSLRTMAILSTGGNLLMLGAFIVIFQFLVRARHITSSLPWITEFDGVVTACGSILYSFEGQAMVLPMENKLKHPTDMTGATGILSTGMSLVSIVYAASGFFGYITYGEDVQGSVTLNLPDTTLYTGVKLALALVMCVTFVVQQYVIIDLLWPITQRQLEKRWSNLRIALVEPVFRAGCVFVAMLLALAVPNLEQIIPFVGSTAGILLAFVFPALLDTLVFLPTMLSEKGSIDQSAIPKTLRCSWFLAKNAFLMAIGIFGMIAGLQSNIRDLVVSA